MVLQLPPLFLRIAALGVACSLGLALNACGQAPEQPEEGMEEQASGPEAAAASGAEVPPAPEQGGPRNWTVRGDGVNLRKEPSLSAAVLTTFSNGTVLDNLGCKEIEGRNWCDVQPLGGGPRGFVAAELLRPAAAPHGDGARGDDDSARRAGQGDFDATGTIPCAIAQGQPMGNCPFGVARAGGGYATVVVTRPDGSQRALYFRMGKAVGADTSQADGYGSVSASKEADLYTVQVGNERYELPEAVVFGG
jgi:hypothetical protein